MNPLSDAPAKNLEELLHRMTNRIRQSLELPEILEATADEMRQLLKTDRVKVYRFHEDGSGEVVAEAINHHKLPSLLGQRFPADDIPEQAREMFLTARQRSIVNVAKQEIGFSPLLDSETQALLNTHIFFRNVDSCHVEYLTSMGVQSSLVVPILHRHRLWGLLVAHHSVPRRFGTKELEIVQLIADQVTVAISHASLLQLTRLQGQHESTINQTVAHLHSTVKHPLERALRHMISATNCVGGRLYLPIDDAQLDSPDLAYRLIAVGRQPTDPRHLKSPMADENEATGSQLHPPNTAALEQIFVWRKWLQAEASNQIVANLWAISDIETAHMPAAMASALASSGIRGVLVAKLIHQNRFLGYLSLFRQAIDTETIWAGQPNDVDPRQQRPRQSFAAWQEIKKDQAHPWSPSEISLAQDLADRFASVVYQRDLYHKIQTLNADLEQRVAQRTAELEQTNQNLKQEISERERTLKDLQAARDALKRLSDQNELILNAAGEGIYGIDLKGKIVFVNPAAAKMLGYQKAALIGRFVHDFLKHSKPSGVSYSWKESPIFQTIRYGRTHHITGDLFQRESGFSFPVEYVSTCIQDNGNTIGAVVIFQDITERQVMESMKDDFVAVVSHELRTPLTSIRAALGLLAQTNLDIPVHKRQRMVEIAFSNTNRLVRLVSDILDVERIKKGKITLSPQQCDLADVISQSADEMRAMAEKQDIHLSVSSFPVQISADRDRMIQTLTNLLSNAIKFSPAGSTVQVTVRQVDASSIQAVETELSTAGKASLRTVLEEATSLLLIQVKDQGRGIPEDKLEDIFGQFEQINASDSEHQGGTGLGLAICRSIVEQHKGAIWAQSILNQGSTFFITLPLLEPDS